MKIPEHQYQDRAAPCTWKVTTIVTCKLQTVVNTCLCDAISAFWFEEISKESTYGLLTIVFIRGRKWHWIDLA